MLVLKEKKRLWSRNININQHKILLRARNLTSFEASSGVLSVSYFLVVLFAVVFFLVEVCGTLWTYYIILHELEWATVTLHYEPVNKPNHKAVARLLLVVKLSIYNMALLEENFTTSRSIQFKEGIISKIQGVFKEVLTAWKLFFF